MSDVTRADYCVIGVAECFRGDGEIMANPIGTIPAVGGRLARDVFEPDLVMTDGEAYEEATASVVLPGIDLAELASYLDRPTASQAIREYRAALRGA